MLHAAAQTPSAVDTASTGYRCPECLVAFAAKQHSQLFCSPAHKTAWTNRWTVRGRVHAVLNGAARITRGGSRGDVVTGKRARSDADQLMDRWIAEDRAAGRMNPVDFMRRRYASGWQVTL